MNSEEQQRAHRGRRNKGNGRHRNIQVPEAEAGNQPKRNTKKKKKHKSRNKNKASTGDAQNVEFMQNPLLVQVKPSNSQRKRVLEEDMFNSVQVIKATGSKNKLNMVANGKKKDDGERKMPGFVIKREEGNPLPRKENSADDIWAEEESIPQFKPIPNSQEPDHIVQPGATFENAMKRDKAAQHSDPRGKKDKSIPVAKKKKKAANGKGNTYGTHASDLFGNTITSITQSPQTRVRFHLMSDSEKLELSREEVHQLPEKNIANLFLIFYKFYEAEKKKGNDQIMVYKQDREKSVASAASSAVLVYAFYKQATKGNYRRRFRIRANFFDVNKRNFDSMWKSLKGMSKRDAMLSYIELIQVAYDLLPAIAPNAGSVDESSGNTGSINAQPLGRTAESSFKFKGYAEEEQNPDNNKNFMRIVSKKIPTTIETVKNEPVDKLSEDIEKYRKTITQAEFARYSMIKMKKMKQENKHVATQLKSMSIKPEDLAKYEQSGEGIDDASFHEIKNLQKDVSRNDEDKDSDLSEDDSSPSSFFPKKKKKYIHSGIRDGPHEEVPRDAKFRNSMAPYNKVMTIVDQIVIKVEEMMEKVDFNTGDKFSGNQLPTIQLHDYLFRLVRYMDAWFYDAPGPKSVGSRSLVLCIIYLQRLIELNSADVAITRYNVHRLFAVCTLVAAKFCEDYIVSNAYWARVSGIPQDQLNEIEELFCGLMKFNFFVTETELKQFYKQHKLV